MKHLSEIRDARACLDEFESAFLIHYRRIRQNITNKRKTLDDIEASVEEEHRELSSKLHELRRKLNLAEVGMVGAMTAATRAVEFREPDHNCPYPNGCNYCTGGS